MYTDSSIAQDSIPHDGYSTVMRRFFALIIDGLILMLISFVDPLFLREDGAIISMAVYVAVSTFIYPLYNILMHAYFGQTIGKMLLRVKVLSADETEIPGLFRAFKRESVTILIEAYFVVLSIRLLISNGYTGYEEQLDAAILGSYVWVALVVWFIAELVTTLVNERRRAVHDYIGDTVVVKLPPRNR